MELACFVLTSPDKCRAQQLEMLRACEQNAHSVGW